MTPCKRPLCGNVITEDKLRLGHKYCGIGCRRVHEREMARGKEKEYRKRSREARIAALMATGAKCERCGAVISREMFEKSNGLPLRYCSEGCRQSLKRMVACRKHPLLLTCAGCSQPFESFRKKKYCSEVCCVQTNYTRAVKYGKERAKVGEVMTTSKKGAWGELVACYDLLSRGYDVFRSVSPTSNFDLVIYDKTTKKLQTVEVRCGRKGKKGYIFTSKPEDGCDLYAVVTDDKEVDYVKQTDQQE